LMKLRIRFPLPQRGVGWSDCIGAANATGPFFERWLRHCGCSVHELIVEAHWH